MDRRWHFLLFLFGFGLPLSFAAFLVVNRPVPPAPFASANAPAPAHAPRPAAQRVIPRASTPAFTSAEEGRLNELARAGGACALLGSPLTARAPLSSLYGLFYENPAERRGDVLDAYFRALSARSPGELEAALRSASHPLLDLTEASLRLGLLPGTAGVRRDPHAAVALLRGLADADSLNAAPSLLLAYALKLEGQPEESAAELERALGRPLFRLYTDEAVAALYQRAQGRPALLEAAAAIEARTPSPDLWPVEDFLVDALVDADPRVAELAYGFGRRHAARESALNFGFSQRVAATAWRRLHPAQKPPRALATRPAPPAKSILADLRLPLPRAACEKELPKLAARAYTPSRKPAIQ